MLCWTAKQDFFVCDNIVNTIRSYFEKLKLESLISAFSSLMQKMTIKAEVVQEKKIVKDRFTVAQKIAQIKDDLVSKKEYT